ncbi:MAG: type II secretion system GspH family protein [Puniceicoccales bacterium]|jgi:type II secretory pathway pseudopilin PulG|nr:type II secretion system GspH family protein [Puniceicoccales bacterium]
MKKKRGSNKNFGGRAFTLVELMAVLGIAFLFVTILFSAGTHLKRKALVLQTKMQLASYVLALEDFYAARGTFPDFLTHGHSLKECSQDFIRTLSQRGLGGTPFHVFGAHEIKDSQVVDAFGNPHLYVFLKRPFEAFIPNEKFPPALKTHIPPGGIGAPVALASIPEDPALPVVCSWE